MTLKKRAQPRFDHYGREQQLIRLKQLNSPIDHKGFSLVELLVAISVLAVLGALVLTAVSNVQNKAQEVRDTVQMRQIYQAWSLAATDNSGKVPLPFIQQGARNRSERHFPGRLAPYLGISFPPNEYSVFLDDAAMPEETPFRDPYLPEPDAGERKTVSYAMNHLGLGTYFSSSFAGAMTSSGDRLQKETRMGDLKPTMIVLAPSKPGQWHVGNVLPFAGMPYDPETHSDATFRLRFSDQGRASFIRADGSAFTTDTIPPTEMWLIDGLPLAN